MNKGFRIGDYVSYWVGRNGLEDIYSNPVKVIGVSEETVTVEGGHEVKVGNIRRIPLSYELLEKMGCKMHDCLAVISEKDPFISYRFDVGKLFIINEPFELRCLCDTVDELQHAISDMRCECEIKL